MFYTGPFFTESQMGSLGCRKSAVHLCNCLVTQHDYRGANGAFYCHANAVVEVASALQYFDAELSTTLAGKVTMKG